MSNALRQLYQNPTLRRLLLPIFARMNPGDINLRHHYTGQKIRLHSFRHKGYWFHGRNREVETMEFFSAAIRPGDRVLEVGGHIGYMTLYFAKLVGERGQVLVCEPGSNNLPYIRANTAGAKHIKLIEKAVSDHNGVTSFYEEGLTGQNNSLLSDYGVYRANCERANASAEYAAREVQTVRIDSLLAEQGMTPNLIKIDIEGAELLAISGAAETLRQHAPALMVEVTEHHEQVYRELTGHGYHLYNDLGRRLVEPESIEFNTLALNPLKHGALIDWLARRQATAAA